MVPDWNRSKPNRTGSASTVFMELFQTDPGVYIELFATGLVRIQNRTCKSVVSVLDRFNLDPFRTGSRTVPGLLSQENKEVNESLQ